MDFPRPELIPHPAVRRLSLYLRQLESLQRKHTLTISSRQLGESLSLTDAQVRKDLACFGQFGHPGIGYRVDDLITQLRKILGTDKTWNVMLIGAGNLGRALLSYQGFNSRGFRICAVFDSDPRKVGQQFGNCQIQAMTELRNAADQHTARLGIIAVPAEAAQQVADMLVSVGVRGLLNFAPIALQVPEHVALNAVDLAVQLEQISFQLNAAVFEQSTQ